MVGTLKKEDGVIFKTDKVMIVRHNKKVGENIEKHNHPGANIYFSLMEGEVTVTLNDDEKHNLLPGNILNFNGENYISAEIIKDAKIQVTLVN